jgi:hypothetical protein
VSERVMEWKFIDCGICKMSKLLNGAGLREHSKFVENQQPREQPLITASAAAVYA